MTHTVRMCIEKDKYLTTAQGLKSHHKEPNIVDTRHIVML